MSFPFAVLAAETAEASTHHQTNPLLPESNELIWGAVSFAILFVVMAKFVFPKINESFKDRTANIEGKLDHAEGERQKASNLVASYEAKLKEANVEAARIVDQARQNADRLETELRVKAEEQARRIVEKAQEAINAEKDRALQSLHDEVGGLVVDLTTRVVGESLDRERQLRLVDQYITDLPNFKPESAN